MARPYEGFDRSVLIRMLKDPKIGDVAKSRIRTELTLQGALSPELPAGAPPRVRSMRFCLPMPTNRTNRASGKGHWTSLYSEDQMWRDAADALLKLGTLPRPPEAPYHRIRLDATLYVWQEMDDENAMARVKPAVDWLVTRGYIVNDRRENIERELPAQAVDRGCQRLVLRISQPKKGGAR